MSRSEWTSTESSGIESDNSSKGCSSGNSSSFFGFSSDYGYTSDYESSSDWGGEEQRAWQAGERESEAQEEALEKLWNAVSCNQLGRVAHHLEQIHTHRLEEENQGRSFLCHAAEHAADPEIFLALLDTFDRPANHLTDTDEDDLPVILHLMRESRWDLLAMLRDDYPRAMETCYSKLQKIAPIDTVVHALKTVFESGDAKEIEALFEYTGDFLFDLANEEDSSTYSYGLTPKDRAYLQCELAKWHEGQELFEEAIQHTDAALNTLEEARLVHRKHYKKALTLRKRTQDEKLLAKHHKNESAAKRKHEDYKASIAVPKKLYLTYKAALQAQQGNHNKARTTLEEAMVIAIPENAVTPPRIEALQYFTEAAIAMLAGEDSVPQHKKLTASPPMKSEAFKDTMLTRLQVVAKQSPINNTAVRRNLFRTSSEMASSIRQGGYNSRYQEEKERPPRSFKRERLQQLMRQISTQLKLMAGNTLVEVECLFISMRDGVQLYIAPNEIAESKTQLFDKIADKTLFREALCRAHPTPNKDKEGKKRTRRYAQKIGQLYEGHRFPAEKSYQSNARHANALADLLLEGDVVELPLEYKKQKLNTATRRRIQNSMTSKPSIYILTGKHPHKERHAEEFLCDVLDVIHKKHEHQTGDVRPGRPWSVISGKMRPCASCGDRLKRTRVSQFNPRTGRGFQHTFIRSPESIHGKVCTLFTQDTHVTVDASGKQQCGYDTGSDSDGSLSRYAPRKQQYDYDTASDSEGNLSRYESAP